VIASDRVVFQARQWVGVRFVHQGRTRFGCDCLGFVGGFMDELGSRTALELLPINYGREPQGQLIEILSKHSRQIPLQAAALLLIQWPLSAHPSHAAIYTGDSMVHSYEAATKVVEHGYRAPWPARTVSIWALPDVAYE
jgi:cell wall-associated NlpC family hydrolase